MNETQSEQVEYQSSGQADRSECLIGCSAASGCVCPKSGSASRLQVAVFAWSWIRQTRHTVAL